MLHLPGNEAMILSRPFSVHGFQKKKKEAVLEILYRVSGRGTQFLSNLTPGAEIRVLGPLGRGFWRLAGKRILLVAGGIGLAPLAFFLEREIEYGNHSTAFSIYLGAKNAEILEGLASRIPAGNQKLLPATDDGSIGYRGPITDILKKDLEHLATKETMILACGPTAMLKSLAELVTQKAVFCEVSLEERMACGIGACLGCVVETRNQNGSSTYKRVCKEGPVFDIREIVWSR